jgi:hypothetical protein
LAEELTDSNPMGDRLESHLTDAIEDGQRLAVLSESPKHAQMLRDILVARGTLEESHLDGTPISIVSPNPARGIFQHEKLIICGPLHSENRGFYLLPQVDSVVVLTYDTQWTQMIESQAISFIDRLNATVGGPDFEPYSQPVLVGDTDPPTPEPSEQSDEESAAPGEFPRSDDDQPVTGEHSNDTDDERDESQSKSEMLIEAMHWESESEYSDRSTRYERETRQYEIRTKEGEMIRRTNHDRVLRLRRTADGDSEYHWAGPDMLSTDDAFVIIPTEIEREIWREHLDEIYSEEVEAQTAMMSLEDWYDSINDIWYRMEADVEDRVKSRPTNAQIVSAIHDRLEETDDEFDRAEGTVRTWFESVRDAAEPLELVERPELVIGPRRADDIRVIARAFDVERLHGSVDRVAGAMRGLRNINRQEGDQYRETIRNRMNATDENRVKRCAEHYTVQSVHDVTDSSE